ncbi:beta-galactosidase [Edaphobacter aggregans]|uniref:Beta-galactosidase n=2 Tax=Edaphobacter aggregans TaxID=570835 RepID=A0A428ME66_9BACT|nr:beta-galactosidase [Edaphobacter aggregans]RSL15157.1 beta-galactosidase [Edaphobacter aggregans]
MNRTLLTALLALVTFPAIAQPHHTFATQADHFTLDGKPFKVISGELHYARIPREYWHARLKMAKAMGLNTIATYVFWNVHEPTPGHYDFTGNNDLAAFIKAAQQEGLYVILRAGPYSCAEWEFGGLPAWLLASPSPSQTSATTNNAVILSGAKNPRISPEAPQTSPEATQNPGFTLRSNDPAFITPAERWIHRLAQEVAPLQIGRGGPILMTQVENEYGNFGSDHAYMAHLKQIFLEAGFTDSLLYSADNWRNIPNGSIPDLFAAVNFGIGNHQGGMDALARVRPDAPLFVSEYWPGWFDSWGHPHETRPIPPQLEDLDYILHRGAGINIYMFHGGTSFGFMSGAGSDKNGYRPAVTSYDYDAPLDESGRPTPKFYAYRKVLAQFTPCPQAAQNSVILSEAKNPRISPEAPPLSKQSQDAQTGNESCLPPIPTTPPIITIPQITFTESTPLWLNLPQPIPSQSPRPMEHFGQSYGYILYRTQIPAAITGDLVLTDLHDYAQIYLNGKLTGTLDRRHHFENTLPLTTTGPTQLDILVANDGRINSTKLMRGESKGITQSVTLAGTPVTNWQVYPLPMTALPRLYAGPRTLYPAGDFTEDARESVGKKVPFTPFPRDTPAFFRAHFTLTQPCDTFLDTHTLGKGAIWINGHPIGRFWNVGPQQTLYVPGPWLRQGTNEIVVFDMIPQPNPHVSGLDHPILDGPVPDQTRSSQQ